MNEERQAIGDQKTIDEPVCNLVPGTSALRVIVDFNGVKPKVRRYGVYRILRPEGNGFYVEPLSGGLEEWIPGHQLCAFDQRLADELRGGCPDVPTDVSVDVIPGDCWSFAWDTDEGVRLYVGRVADVDPQSGDCGVRYAEIREDGSLGHFARGSVRTPLAAAEERGSVKKGRWVPAGTQRRGVL